MSYKLTDFFSGFFIRKKAFQNSSVIPADYEALFADYSPVFQQMKRLHSEIRELARKDFFDSGAKRLRMLRKQGSSKTLVLQNEFEMGIFQDYLIYMHRPRGVSLVQQMLNSNRYGEGTPERPLLEGMAQARFSVFMVKELVPPGGFVALDTVTGGTFFILDRSICRQNALRILMGLRIFPYKGGWLHTGAAIPLVQADDNTESGHFLPMLSQKDERDLNEQIFFLWRGLEAQREGSRKG